MLTFALVVAARNRRIAPAVMALLQDAAAAEVPFPARRHLVWSDPSGSVVFAGWQSTGGEDPIGSRWHSEHGSLTAFTGHAWPRAGPWAAHPSWAAQLAEYLHRHPLDGGTDDLLGVFTAVAIDEHGCGTLGTDPLGLSLTYASTHRDLRVFSSRASIAAAISAAAEGHGSPRRDVTSTGLLAFSGRSMGLGTGYEGVQILPPGARVVIDPKRGSHVERRNPRPWRFATNGSLDPRDLLNGLRADLATSLRAALSIGVPHHVLRLTGGRDSRMILAAILDAGLAREFEYQTWGADDLPDVVIARQIAAAFGLPHEVNVPAPDGRRWRAERDALLDATGQLARGQREATFRLTVGGHLGMWNVKEPQVACPPHGDRVVLSGLLGELLRTNFPGSTRFRTLKHLDQFLFGDLQLGSAGILRPEIRSLYNEQVWEMAFEDLASGDTVQDVVDAFNIRHWYRCWLVHGLEVDEENRVFPLYSPFGVRSAFEIGPQARHSEWLHREVIQAVSPRLADLPFADDGWRAPARPRSVRRAPRWRQAVAPKLPTPRPIRPIAGPGEPAPARTVKWDLRAASERTDVEIMRRFLLDDASNPVQELLDPSGVAAALNRFSDLTGRAKVQLYGALSAALWLGHEEIAYRAGVDEIPPSVGPAT